MRGNSVTGLTGLSKKGKLMSADDIIGACVAVVGISVIVIMSSVAIICACKAVSTVIMMFT
jgi:hypothetical protein